MLGLCLSAQIGLHMDPIWSSIWSSIWSHIWSSTWSPICSSIWRATWALQGPGMGPLKSLGMGACGPPWALVGHPGPSWAGALWAPLGPCGPGPCGPGPCGPPGPLLAGPLLAGPLWAPCGPDGLAPAATRDRTQPTGRQTTSSYLDLALARPVAR